MVYVYLIWNPDMKDLYHEVGAIEIVSDIAYESRSECDIAARKMVDQLREVDGIYYEYTIQQLKIKKKIGEVM